MIHVMCGIPGSGKTTLSKQLANENDASLYCYDTLSRSRWSIDVHPVMFEHIVQDLVNEKEVICDDLHITKASRKNLLDALCGVECVKILHVMQTPLNVCIERNRKRERGKGRLPDVALVHCRDQYESPYLDEGWDEIVYHLP